MRRRLEDWITGLKWDWNISRQRHYGVPFPVWFCADCERPILAELAALPVDPLTDPPSLDACPDCGGDRLIGEADVMDTWMTSSLSPHINDGWAACGFTGDGPLAPMSLRVQGFEIIRTWLFYTLVQSHLLADRLPWTAAMISGWGLNEQGKKIAKRDLESSTTADGFNRYVPDQVIERYGTDALRLWATRARVGNDLRYHEKDVRTGRKLAVKLGLLAPFAPFITENQYQRLFRDAEGTVSLHLTRWPHVRPEWAGDRTEVERLVTVLDAVRALRTRHRLGGGVPIAALCLDARTPAAEVLVGAIEEPLRAAARARAVRLAPAGTPSGVDDLYVGIEP